MPDQPAPPLQGDPRLSRSLGTAAWRYATIDEHAHAAGMDVEEFLDHVEPWLDGGWIRIEAHDGRLFCDTAPGGVAAPGITTNLWSGMRRSLAAATAHRRYEQIRSLEAGGWRVETRPVMLGNRFGSLRPLPWCAVEVSGTYAALLWEPDADQLGGADGICDMYADAGEALVAVTCAAASLETTVAAVRSWVLTRGAVAGGRWLSVLVLEAPTYHATLLRCTDNSVTPVAYARPMSL